MVVEPSAEAEREEFRKTVKDDLDFATATLTDRTRVISLGIVGLCWAFIIGELPKSGVLHLSLVNLLGPMFLALCSILCDWLQYLAGYASSRNVMRSIEQQGDARTEYDPTSLPYRMRLAMFYWKQGFSLVAALWFLITILASLLSALPSLPSAAVA